MKKYISLLLISILLLGAVFGCKKKEEIVRTDYTVNESDKINIGVLVPTSGDNKNIGQDIVTGLNYANKSAASVNIDKTYELSLSVYDVNSDVEAAAKKLIDQKVAAVVCYSGNEEKTQEIIKNFETVNTPLLFVDNNSKSIEETVTALSMSVPVSYQASVAAKFLKDKGYKKAAIVYEDTDSYKEFSENIKKTFGTATEYSYDDFNAKTVTKDYDCAFVVGNNKFSLDVTKKIKSASSGFTVMMPELFDKDAASSSTFNGCYFLSKFESDSDNHYVTSFITGYTKQNHVSASDISAAIVYGYDAYMLIYGALAHFNPLGSDPLASVKNGSSEQDEVTISTKMMLDALKEKQYLGVIDSNMVFEDNGCIKPSFVYVDSVEGGIASMHKKFVY